jgi:hypothetical protein
MNDGPPAFRFGRVDYNARNNECITNPQICRQLAFSFPRGGYMEDRCPLTAKRVLTRSG